MKKYLLLLFTLSILSTSYNQDFEFFKPNNKKIEKVIEKKSPIYFTKN